MRPIRILLFSKIKLPRCLKLSVSCQRTWTINLWRRGMIRFALAVALCGATAVSGAQSLYKCEGGTGRAIFQDKPCTVEQAQPAAQPKTSGAKASQSSSTSVWSEDRCQSETKKLGKWVVDARRDMNRAGGNTSRLQSVALDEYELGAKGIAEKLGRRAALLLGNETLTPAQVVADLHGLCMSLIH